MTSLEQIISRKRPINKELVGFDCVKCGREDSKIFRKNYMQSVLKQRTGNIMTKRFSIGFHLISACNKI